MLKHFEALAKGTGLPIMIYNVVPWCYLSPQLLTRIIDNVEGVIGVKQSAGDMKMLADLDHPAGQPRPNHERRGRPDVPLLRPREPTAPSRPSSPRYPDLYVQLWDAVQGGDHKHARTLHEKLLVLWNALLGDNLPANVKCAQTLLGRKAGVPRPPMPASSPAQAAAIRAALQEAGQL